MLRGNRSFAPCLVLFALVALVLAARSAVAQTQPNTPNVSGANGVLIDADGVLRMQHYPDPGGQIVKQRIAQAKVSLNPDVLKSSKLRKVSLNRLEAAVRAKLDKKEAPTEEMAYLAGLTRVRYLFYYPETQDIVLAGPAEGWIADASNKIVGMDSGKPIVQLQDLIVALRTFSPDNPKMPTILCSVDPSPEGLARMQDYFRSLRGEVIPGEEEVIAHNMRTSLGMQSIRIAGVAPNTHFAQVILECDYRMKLIGIGLERPPVKIAAWVDKASPTKDAKSLERWFFIPDYKSARVAADSMGLELVGDVVKLVNENQLVANDGSRAVTGKVNKSSELFTRTFTQKFAELAAKVPVFAEMRNVIDLAIVSAFIKQQKLYEKSGWMAETFRDEGALAVETYQTPLQVESVCTAIWRGNTLLTPISGGVTIRAKDALLSSNLLPDDDGKVTELRESIDLKDLPADKWWWD